MYVRAHAHACVDTRVLNLKYVCIGVCMLKPVRSGGEAGGKGGWGGGE